MLNKYRDLEFADDTYVITEKEVGKTITIKNMTGQYWQEK